MKPLALDVIDSGPIPPYPFTESGMPSNGQVRSREARIFPSPDATPASPPRVQLQKLQAAKSATLNSWKDIATYLDRGVRTVQRWESGFGLPVHRIGKGKRSPVFAFTADLDFWLQTRRASLPPDIKTMPPAGIIPLDHRTRTSTALHRSQELAARLQELTWEHRRQADKLAATALRLYALKTRCETRADRKTLHLGGAFRYPSRANCEGRSSHFASFLLSIYFRSLRRSFCPFFSAGASPAGRCSNIISTLLVRSSFGITLK